MIYENTPENREKVGWDRVPGHVFGDHEKPFVFHDTLKGRFHYVDETEKELLERVLEVV